MATKNSGPFGNIEYPDYGSPNILEDANDTTNKATRSTNKETVPVATIPTPTVTPFSLPSSKSSSKDTGKNETLSRLNHLIGQSDYYDKVLKKLNSGASMPQLQTWDQVVAQMQGYDEQPYREKRKLYEQYIASAKNAIMQWNELQPKKKQLSESEIESQLREINKAPEAPTRTWGEVATDPVYGLYRGIMNLGGMIGSYADIMADEAKSSGTKWFEAQAADATKKLSAKTRDSEITKAFDNRIIANDADRSAVSKMLSEAGNYLKYFTLADLGELAGNTVPTSLLRLGLTKLTGTLALKALTASGTKLLTKGGELVVKGTGLGTGALVNGVFSGMDAATQAYQNAQEMTVQEIKSTPEGRALWEQKKGNLQAVRHALGRDAALIAQWCGAAVGVGGALLPGSAERSVMKAVGGRSVGKVMATATGALIGGLEEAGTQVGANIGSRAVGANTPLTEGVAEAGMAGLIGEGLGAAPGLAAFARPRGNRTNANANATNANTQQGGGQPPGGTGGQPPGAGAQAQATTTAPNLETAVTLMGVENGWTMVGDTYVNAAGDPVVQINQEGKVARIIDPEVRAQLENNFAIDENGVVQYDASGNPIVKEQTQEQAQQAQTQEQAQEQTQQAQTQEQTQQAQTQEQAQEQTQQAQTQEQTQQAQTQEQTQKTQAQEQTQEQAQEQTQKAQTQEQAPSTQEQVLTKEEPTTEQTYKPSKNEKLIKDKGYYVNENNTPTYYTDGRPVAYDTSGMPMPLEEAQKRARVEAPSDLGEPKPEVRRKTPEERQAEKANEENETQLKQLEEERKQLEERKKQLAEQKKQAQKQNETPAKQAKPKSTAGINTNKQAALQEKISTRITNLEAAVEKYNENEMRIANEQYTLRHKILDLIKEKKKLLTQPESAGRNKKEKEINKELELARAELKKLDRLRGIGEGYAQELKRLEKLLDTNTAKPVLKPTIDSTSKQQQNSNIREDVNTRLSDEEIEHYSYYDLPTDEADLKVLHDRACNTYFQLSAKDVGTSKEERVLELMKQTHIKLQIKATKEGFASTSDKNNWVAYSKALIDKAGTTHSVSLETIIKVALESNQVPVEVKEGLRAFLESYKKAGMPLPSVIWDYHPGLTELGGYYPKTNRLQINAGTTPWALAHEIMHSVTAYNIRKLEFAALAGNKEAANKIALLSYIQDALHKNYGDKYAWTNLRELFAELTNPEIIRMLKAFSININDVPTAHTYTVKMGSDIIGYVTGNPKAALDFIRPTSKLKSCWNAIVNWVHSLVTDEAHMNVSRDFVEDSMSAFTAITNANEKLLGPRTLSEMRFKPTSRAKTEETISPVTRDEAGNIHVDSDSFIVPYQVRSEQIKAGNRTIEFDNAVDKAAALAMRDNSDVAQSARDFLTKVIGLSNQQVTDLGGRINDAIENGKRTFNNYAPFENTMRTDVDAMSATMANNSGISQEVSDLENKLATQQDIVAPQPKEATIQHINDAVVNNTPILPQNTPWIKAPLKEKVTRLKNSFSNLFDWYKLEVGDSAQPFITHLESMAVSNPELASHIQEVLNTYRTADNKAVAVKDAILKAIGDKSMAAEVSEMANKLNADPQDLWLKFGYALTAAYAPTAQARILEYRTSDLVNARKEILRLEKALKQDPKSEKLSDDLKKKRKEFVDISQDIVDKSNMMNNRDLNAELTTPLAGGMTPAQAENYLANFKKQFGEETFKTLSDKVYTMNALRLAFDIENLRYTPSQVFRFLDLENRAKNNKAIDLKKIRAKMEELIKARENGLDELAREKLRNEVAELVKTEYVPLSGDPHAGLENDTAVIRDTSPNTKAPRKLEGRLSTASNGLDETFKAISTSAQYRGWVDFQRSFANLWANMSEQQRTENKFERRTLKSYEALPTDAVVYRTTARTAYAFKLPPGIMEALRRENRRKVAAGLQIMSKLTSFYGRLATQFNFGFAQWNMLRDIEERWWNLSNADLTDANGNKININKAIWQYAFNWDTIKAAHRWAFDMDNLASTEAGKAMISFANNGGFTNRTDAIMGRKAAVKESRVNKSKVFGTLQTVNNFIERYNRAWDMISGLGAYRALLSQGMTEKAAAAATLESMDFGKRGRGIDIARCIYPFVQVKATSGINAIHSLYSPKTGFRWPAVARLGAMTMALMALKAMVRGAADEDEGGNKLDQLSEYIKNNSFNFLIGDRRFSIALGEGMPKLANVIADKILGFGTGELKGADALGKTMKEGIIPTLGMDIVDIDWQKDPAAAFMLQFCPTIFLPLASSALNKRTDGRSMYSMRAKAGEFKYNLGRASTAPFYHDMAKHWYDFTGIDVYPEQVKAMFESLPGIATQLQGVFITNPHRESLGMETSSPLFRRATGPLLGNINDQFQSYKAMAEDLEKQKNAGEELSPEETDILRVANSIKSEDNKYAQRVKQINKMSISQDAKNRLFEDLMNQVKLFRYRAVGRFRRADNRPTTSPY